jgi:putative sterol carrier protein
MLGPILTEGIPEEKKLGEKFNRIVQFDIPGDKEFYMEIKRGKTLSLVEGKHAKPDAIISSDKETMASLASGESPMVALFQGKVKLKGNMSELLKLKDLIFPSP